MSRRPLYHNFTTNAAPSNGSCSQQPRLGYANYTLFNVSCPGFEDPDEPILYTINFDFQGTMFMCVKYEIAPKVFYFKSVHSCSIATLFE